MTEVRKWYIGVYGGEAQARPCSPAEFEIINEREGRYFVLKEDYDSAAQCFLTAAEGCVAAERRERALQQRLTAADEQVNVLETEVARLNRVKLALKELVESHAGNLSVYRFHLSETLAMAEKVRDASLGMQRKYLADLIDYLHQNGAALKQAEGGGDET